jgi:hypothetical protein
MNLEDITWLQQVTRFQDWVLKTTAIPDPGYALTHMTGTLAVHVLYGRYITWCCDQDVEQMLTGPVFAKYWTVLQETEAQAILFPDAAMTQARLRPRKHATHLLRTTHHL